MKLMLFTDTLGDVNGVSRFIQNVGSEAHREGKRLQIVTSTRFDLPDVPYITNARPIFAAAMPGYKNLEITLPPLVRMLRIARRFRPDVIHISTPGSVGLVGLAAAKMLRVPICGVYHTDFPAYIDHLFNDGVYTRVCTDCMRSFYKRFNTIFTRSAGYMDSLEALGIDRSRMVRLTPGIDLDSFRASDRDPNYWDSHPDIRRDSVKVLSCGRISVEKNLPLLTEIWPAIRSRARSGGKDAQLIVVGDGPYRSEMEAALAPHDAHFLGFRSGKELSTIYASCDLFVFPSLTDTLGQVVIESQSAGLPVVVASEGGPKEVVDDGRTGFVLPPHPADVWVDTVVGLITDSDRRTRMGQSAQSHAQQFTIAASFEHFWNVHADAITGHPGAMV